MTTARAVTAALAVFWSGAAFAGDAAPETDSCSFFQNTLIGTRCAGTFSVGAGLRTTLRDIHGDQFGGSPGILETEVRFQSPSASFSITPASWLTIGFSSEYTVLDASASFVPTIGTAQFAELHRSNADRQTFFANVNVIDTDFAGARYVINLFAGDSFVPEHDGINSDNRAFVGYTSSSKWQLWQPNLSLNFQSRTEAAFYTDRDAVILFSASRMLLADDALGIAFGPVFEADRILSGGSSALPDSTYRAGAEVLAQPFKDSSSVILSGMVLDAKVTRSIGQAAFVNEALDARETIASGSVRFNFKY